MVRLKASVWAGSAGTVRRFQFHYGTIKSSTRWRGCANRCYFNSTMVRLKVGMVLAKTIKEAYFNSTMVRLKECFR